MTAKCLFGPPEPASCMKLAEEMMEATKKKFEAKWNLSIVTTRSALPQDQISATTPLTASLTSIPKIQWEEVTCKADVDSRVPLLYVSNAENCEPGFGSRHGNLVVSMDHEDLIPDELKDGSDSGIFDVSRRSSSPRLTASLYSVHKNSLKSSKHRNNRLVSPNGPNYGDNDDKGLSVSALKQRCITDYLKVKKVPGGLNAIKTMQ